MSDTSATPAATTPQSIQVPAEQLTKMASYINEVGPQLEQLKAYNEALIKVAGPTIDHLITAGLLPKDRREAAVNELKTGGFAKFAEAVEYASRNVGPRSMGESIKSASDSATTDAPKVRKSDEIWNRQFTPKA